MRQPPERAASILHGLLKQYPAIRMAAAVNADDVVQWAVPQEMNASLAGVDLAETAWRTAIAEARRSGRETAVARSGDWEEDTVGVAYPPLSPDPGASCIARISLGPILADATDEYHHRDYVIDIVDGESRLLRFGNGLGGHSGFQDQRVVRIADQSYQLIVSLTEASASARLARLTNLILWLGIPASLLLASAYGLARANRHRRFVRAEEHLARWSR